MKKNIYTRGIPEILFLTVIFLYSSLSALANPQDQFNKANNLYRSGSYKDAITSYESLLKGGYSSSDLYYNLGNSYYKSGNIPASIISYERALKLNPGDEDILFNLRLANLNTVDKIEPLPKLFYQQWWDNYVSLFSADKWSTYSIILLWIAVLFAAIYIFGNTIFLKKTGFFGNALFLIAGLFLLATAWIQNNRVNNDKSAVITETSAYIKSSPDDKSTSLFMLHSGTKIDIIDELSGWKKIRIANGNVGWINDKDIEII